MFEWLFGKSRGKQTRSDLPQFYPGLDGRRLAEFLTPNEYRRLKTIGSFYVFPLASSDGDGDQAHFGYGLARLLIRNLMLLLDVSIHGPEDTASVPYESGGQLATQRRSGHVTGVAGFGARG
jgi:hypothetical protein